MDRFLIIGEQPSATGDDSKPLEGAIGARLAEYAGLSLDAYLERTERRNLVAYASPTWPANEAARNAGMIWGELLGRQTLMLGQRVSAAFGVKWAALQWVTLDGRGTRVAIIPHPSTRNLWWNDASNRAAARRFLAMTFGTAPFDER